MYSMEKYILLFICSLLLLVSVGSKGKGELPIVVLDFPLDFNFAGTEFDIELSFRTKSKRRLSLEVSSTGTQSKKFREFKYDAIVAHRTEVTQKIKVKIHLRDSLAYLENKIIDVQPDLYTDEIQVTGLLLDDFRGGLYSKTVLAGDFLRLPLVPPWSRPKKPGFSFLWPWEQLLKINQPKVEKCQNLRGEFEATYSQLLKNCCRCSKVKEFMTLCTMNRDLLILSEQ